MEQPKEPKQAMLEFYQEQRLHLEAQLTKLNREIKKLEGKGAKVKPEIVKRSAYSCLKSAKRYQTVN